MPRIPTNANVLEPEHQEELLNLLERFGEIKDPSALADIWDVTPTAIHAFLRTTQAKAASAKCLPGEREANRKSMLLEGQERHQEEIDAGNLSAHFEGYTGGYSVREDVGEEKFISHRNTINKPLSK